MLAKQQESVKLPYSILKFHRFGNKAGKLLATLCSGPRQPPYISTLKNPAGSLVTTPVEVSKLLTEYYTSLYSEDPIDQEKVTTLLAGVRLPQLTSDQLEALNALISLEEIQLTIKSFSSAKAPGRDGNTAKFYKRTIEFIPTL